MREMSQPRLAELQSRKKIGRAAPYTQSTLVETKLPFSHFSHNQKPRINQFNVAIGDIGVCAHARVTSGPRLMINGHISIFRFIYLSYFLLASGSSINIFLCFFFSLWSPFAGSSRAFHAQSTFRFIFFSSSSSLSLSPVYKMENKKYNVLSYSFIEKFSRLVFAQREKQSYPGNARTL